MMKAIHLHDYQKEMLSRLAEAWRTHRSMMVQMPTGTGKTVVLAELVSEECGVRGVECGGAPVVTGPPAYRNIRI